MLITVTDYNNEINRVQIAMGKTSSPKQRRDYGKYLNRLKRELSGAHREKGEGRFVALRRTHPRLYNYCMDGGAFDTDGFWKPTKQGLGMSYCIDELNRLYGKDFIKY